MTRRRRRRLLQVVPLAVAFSLSGLSVWATSNAAFSVEPDSAPHSLSPATSFATGPLAPGSSGERCVVVPLDPGSPGSQRIYFTDVYWTRRLASYLVLTVDVGSGGSAATCAGFIGASIFRGTLAAAARDHRGFGSGLSTVSAGPARLTATYRIRYTLLAAAPNSVAEGTAGASLVWQS